MAGFRWWILSLLFIATTTINYLDRAILGVLLPEIQKDLQFSQEAHGKISSGAVPGYLLGPIGYTPILVTMSCFYLLAWMFLNKLLGSYDQVKLHAGAMLMK